MTRPVYQNVTQTLPSSVPASFEAFYHGTASRLLRYAYGLTGDMAEAQDFTQEAYVRAWQRWKHLCEYDNPESWLRLVVTRLATDRWRWLRVRDRGLPPAEPAPGPGEDLVVLVAELKRLPMPQRRALVLHYLLDRPVADIARETGVSVNTVKSWLLRGRANLAAQLSESDTAEPTPAMAPTAPVEAIAERGRRKRRRRNTLRSIVAFLTTTAATSAYLLFAPPPEPEPTVPDLILPYSVDASFAFTAVDGQHALMAWSGMRGEARAAVLDLKRDRLAGAPLDLGNWSEPVMVLGFSNVGAHVLGYNDYDGHHDWALYTIDLASGKLLWQHRTDLGGPGHAVVFRDTVLIVEETREDTSGGHVTALDARTGKPKWGRDEPIAHVVNTGTGPDPSMGPDPFRAGNSRDDRFALLRPDGVVRVLDTATGRQLSVRSGITSSAYNDFIFGDFLYRSGRDGFYRAPLTGESPIEQIADLKRPYVAMCGRYLCAGDPAGIEVRAYDLRSGREVRRFVARMAGRPKMSDRGMILPSGTAEASSVILGYDGKQIGPPSVANRWAQWVGNDHVLLGPEIPQPTMVDSDNHDFRRTVGLSIYSFTTGKQTSLGEQVLHGPCAAVAGKLVCPTETGFTLYH